VEGRVEYVSPDAAELPDTRKRDRKDTRAHGDGYLLSPVSQTLHEAGREL